MTSISGNAEASSSRPRLADRARSVSRARKQNVNPSIAVNGVSVASGNGSGPVSKRASSATRPRVRTVPPSAKFDPPSPQLAPIIVIPGDASSPGASAAATATPRRRPRLRYSSSSGSESASDDSDSDEEPPWWTFTQRGMQRLRAIGERGRPNATTASEAENGGEVESGWESAVARRKGKERDRARERERSRESAKDKGKEKEKRKASGREDSGNSSAPNSAVVPSSRGSKQPFYLRPANLKTLRRLSGMDLETGGMSSDHMTVPTTAPAMARSSSAPSSPVDNVQLPALITTGPRALDPAAPLTVPGPRSRRSYRRQNSAPGIAQRGTNDSLTDSEAMMAPSRLRSRQRIFASFAHPLHERDEDSEDAAAGGSDRAETTARRVLVSGSGGEGLGVGEEGDDEPHTPTRPRARRMQSHNLRIRLPPPISEHFAHGWPHVGSWQDALYGNYDEVIASRSASRRNTGVGEYGGAASMLAASIALPPSRKASEGRDGAGANGSGGGGVNGKAKRGSGDTRDSGLPQTPRVGAGTATTPSTAPAPKKRAKSRRPRNRRYRTAQVPPTPGGLGFTVGEKAERGSISESGFDQGAEADTEGGAGLGLGTIMSEGGGGRVDRVGESTNPFDRIAEEDLVREETIVSDKSGRGKEKDGAAGTGGRGGAGTGKGVGLLGGSGWWRRGMGRKSAVRKQYIEDLDWRTRFRRTLFLDARVTVYLRVFNLGVIVALLALAVRIRLELISLSTPGIIGPSTTLIMAYSSFTIVHCLTAIYREYFGRPIGLWGLRSKMLWVCLDLLFVSLWSSAISLASNDYISTPLDCTPMDPWWTSGIDYYDLVNSTTGSVTSGRGGAGNAVNHVMVSAEVIESSTAAAACQRQVGCIALSLLALLLYAGNMVLSLFRIFETVRRTADPSKAVMV